MPMLTLSTPAGSPRSVAMRAIAACKFIEIVLDRMEEAFAGLCESGLPSAALKQADAQITFQRRDIAAHRGRRQGEPPGGG